MAKRNSREVPYKKRRFHLNVGIVVLIVGVVYLTIFGILAMTSKKTKFYEVSPGTNAENNSKIYSGLAIRKEKIATAKSTGYIEFFVLIRTAFFMLTNYGTYWVYWSVVL